MALGSQVIDLFGPDLLHDHCEARCVSEVSVVKMKAVADRGIPREKVIDALAVQAAGAANQPVYVVLGLTQEEFGKIRSILTRNPGNQCTFHEASFQSVNWHRPSRNMIVGASSGRTRSNTLMSSRCEFPKPVSVRIMFTGIEDFDSHR